MMSPGLMNVKVIYTITCDVIIVKGNRYESTRNIVHFHCFQIACQIVTSALMLCRAIDVHTITITSPPPVLVVQTDAKVVYNVG